MAARAPLFVLMPETDSGSTMHADLTLDSSLESVDSAEELVLREARELGLDEDAQHYTSIAVRECMVNAVAHGNRYNGRKKVRLQVWRTEESITVQIDDEGDGFDHDEVPNPLEEENLMRHSGRGLLMIRAFMDETTVTRRVPKGTCVRMVKYLRPPAAGNS